MEKSWVRIIIAFLLGGVLREAIFISTGDPNRPRGKYFDMITLATVAGIYIVLSYYFRNKKKKNIG